MDFELTLLPSGSKNPACETMANPHAGRKRRKGTREHSFGMAVGRTLFLCVMMILLFTGCEVEDMINRILAPAVPTPNPLSGYGILLQTLQSDIDKITSEENLDNDLLWENYSTLLSLYIYEYRFKSTAYEHFTEDYDSKKFEGYAKRYRVLVKEMANYFDETDVTETYIFYTHMAYRDYAEDRFDYDQFAEYYPDIDLMWEKYIDSAIAEIESSLP